MAFGIGALITAFVMLLVVQAGDLLAEVSSDIGVAVLELLKLGIPILGGVLLALVARRRILRRSDPGRPVGPVGLRYRWVGGGLLALAYLVTWIFGAPSVQSSLDRQAFELWKRLEARRHHPEMQLFPHIRTLLALPVAPGFILSYHEFQVAGLHGWGGWTLHFWYGTGSRKLVHLTSWIS